jgi:hypothetical protein
MHGWWAHNTALVDKVERATIAEWFWKIQTFYFWIKTKVQSLLILREYCKRHSRELNSTKLLGLPPIVWAGLGMPIWLLSFIETHVKQLSMHLIRQFHFSLNWCLFDLVISFSLYISSVDNAFWKKFSLRFQSASFLNFLFFF